MLCFPTYGGVSSADGCVSFVEVFFSGFPIFWLYFFSFCPLCADVLCLAAAFRLRFFSEVRVKRTTKFSLSARSAVSVSVSVLVRARELGNSWIRRRRGGRWKTGTAATATTSITGHAGELSWAERSSFPNSFPKLLSGRLACCCFYTNFPRRLRCRRRSFSFSFSLAVNSLLSGLALFCNRWSAVLKDT